MNNSISLLLQALDKAQTPSEWEPIINRIAEFGEAAISELLKYEETLYRRPGKYVALMQTFQRMGYPANRSALKSIVSHASRSNAPGWGIAKEILVGIGEPAIPEVRDAFHFYYKDLEEYKFEVDGLCIMLEGMGSPTIDPLLPELLYLLRKGIEIDLVYQSAIRLIKMIGSPKADAAIPMLLEAISSKRTEYIRNISIQALQAFKLSAILPLIPVLQSCLLDPSEAIRNSARLILKTIDEKSDFV